MQVCYFKTDHPGVMLSLLKKVPRDQDPISHFHSLLKFQKSRAPPQISISSLCNFIGQTKKNIDCQKKLTPLSPNTARYTTMSSTKIIFKCGILITRAHFTMVKTWKTCSIDKTIDFGILKKKYPRHLRRGHVKILKRLSLSAEL